MGTDNTLELRDENRYPEESVLQAVLGSSYDAYRHLMDLYGQNGMTAEWRYYKDGKAWLCKVQKNKRTIVWMSAWKGYIQAAIYIPERMLDALFNQNIREETKEEIRNTPNVGKSKPCIFDIRDTDRLDDFAEVMQFKIETK